MIWRLTKQGKTIQHRIAMKGVITPLKGELFQFSIYSDDIFVVFMSLNLPDPLGPAAWPLVRAGFEVAGIPNPLSDFRALPKIRELFHQGVPILWVLHLQIPHDEELDLFYLSESHRLVAHLLQRAVSIDHH